MMDNFENWKAKRVMLKFLNSQPGTSNDSSRETRYSGEWYLILGLSFGIFNLFHGFESILT